MQRVPRRNCERRAARHDRDPLRLRGTPRRVHCQGNPPGCVQSCENLNRAVRKTAEEEGCTTESDAYDECLADNLEDKDGKSDAPACDAQPFTSCLAGEGTGGAGG